MSNTIEIKVTPCKTIVATLKKIFPDARIYKVNVNFQKWGLGRRFYVNGFEIAAEAVDPHKGQVYFSIGNRKALKKPSATWKTDVENEILAWAKSPNKAAFEKEMKALLRK